MEQLAERHDRGDKGEQDAPAGGGAEPKEPFSLLQELPGPLMRQLVQRHLDAKDCLALLRTSHALARAAVQHRTHQQRRALTWTWQVRKLEGSKEYSSMDAPQAATAAALAVDWAPAELHVELWGPWDGRFAVFSLPAALRSLITSLSLIHMHLAPAAMDSLQRCQRLHTLSVDRCPFAEAPLPLHQPARTLQALPLLRTFTYMTYPPWQLPEWAVRDLGTLCALATDVRSREHTEEWASRFTHATRWDVCRPLISRTLQALLQLPHLRHVQTPDLDLSQDHSQQQCLWETLTLTHLGDVQQLLRLPSGVGRVVVTERVSLLGVDEQERTAAALLRWCAPGRVRVEVDAPPTDAKVKRWCLDAEDEQGGFFQLWVDRAGAVAAHASLLRRTVLPQGGGPRTLELQVSLEGAAATQLLQQLAPLLAGTRVRTLCMHICRDEGHWTGGSIEFHLSALPATIACFRLILDSVEQAREVMAGEKATHDLRLVVLLMSWDAEEERELRGLCTACQPLVRLEVGSWR